MTEEDRAYLEIVDDMFPRDLVYKLSAGVRERRLLETALRLIQKRQDAIATRNEIDLDRYGVGGYLLAIGAESHTLDAEASLYEDVWRHGDAVNDKIEHLAMTALAATSWITNQDSSE